MSSRPSLQVPFHALLVQHCKRYFDFFDHDKVGRVLREDIPTLVRVCGATPLEADLDIILSTADPDERGSCDFDNFLKALRVAYDNSLTDADAREAFRGLDYANKGVISQHELRYFLGTMGDVLSAEELNRFMEEMSSEFDLEGNLLYTDAVYKMTPDMLR